MRTTASFELFPDAPSERVMARARYLVREGRLVDAERAYRDVLAEHPELKGGGAECFELLRSRGRREEALRLADSARAAFGGLARAPGARWDPGRGGRVRGGGAGGRAAGAARGGRAGDRRGAPLRVLCASSPGRADAGGALVRRDRHGRARVRRRQRCPG